MDVPILPIEFNRRTPGVHISGQPTAIPCYYFSASADAPHRKYAADMAITTDSTQRGADQRRTDSGVHESYVSSRATRPSADSARDLSVSNLSGDRALGRLRPVSSASHHDTVVPDRPAVSSSTVDAMRKLSPSEFNTAMSHFYRGEVQRSNVWRTRLDTTTYWAVFTSAATLSFAFSSASNPHFLIPINSILVAIFLVMEGRRYRYYEIWASRVRVIETGYFAQMLAPDSVPRDQEWASHLASDLLTPHFTISVWEAIGRRLRRNYLWIFALLALRWNLKVYLHPLPARDFSSFIDRATVGVIPGWMVFTIGVLFNAAIATFAIGTVRLRE